MEVVSFLATFLAITAICRKALDSSVQKSMLWFLKPISQELRHLYSGPIY